MLRFTARKVLDDLNHPSRNVAISTRNMLGKELLELSLLLKCCDHRWQTPSPFVSFRREALLLGRLDHPSIIKMYHFAKLPQPFMVGDMTQSPFAFSTHIQSKLT
jgi:hypothetical protein